MYRPWGGRIRYHPVAGRQGAEDLVSLTTTRGPVSTIAMDPDIAGIRGVRPPAQVVAVATWIAGANPFLRLIIGLISTQAQIGGNWGTH